MTQYECYKREIRWQMRRGLLELDIYMRRFIVNGFDKLSIEELRCLDDILQYDDQTLLQIMNGNQSVKDSNQVALIKKIRNS